jgi:methionine aminotransferase
MKSKLPNVGTTIFSTMSALAVQEGALNLGQGFPGFPIDERLIDLVTKAMKDGFNQYAPMPGMPVLRQIITEQLNAKHGCNYDWNSEVNITAGASQAIFTAISTLIFPGDEVILFAPAYDCYAPAVELNGGKVIWIELEGEDFHIPWEKVKAAINDRTKLMLINTPHNPTGAVNSLDDAHKLLEVVRDTNIFIISDEVYEHIVFDGKKHQSVLRYPKLAERSFVINSFGKTYHTTGWKIGYCIAPQNLTTEFRKVHQFNVFSVNSVAQMAFDAIIDKHDLYLELNDFYQQKRDYFRLAIQSSRFNLLPCEGTYFQLASYSRITEEKDTEFVRRMTRDMGVAAIPVSVFYRHQVDNSVIRFCFAKEEETLKRAADLIVKM